MPLRKKSYNKDSGVDSLPNESVPSNMEDTSMITNEKQKSLVVDDRVLPDSSLPTEYVEGVLDIAQEGSGLLRPNFHPSDHDIYISSSQIRRFNLRVGDLIGGQARRPKENERYWGLLKVEKVNGDPIEELPIDR